MDAEGAPTTEGEKVLHLIDRITNERLLIGTVSNIVATPEFLWNFQAISTNVVILAGNLKLIGT